MKTTDAGSCRPWKKMWSSVPCSRHRLYLGLLLNVTVCIEGAPSVSLQQNPNDYGFSHLHPRNVQMNELPFSGTWKELIQTNSTDRCVDNKSERTRCGSATLNDTCNTKHMLQQTQTHTLEVSRHSRPLGISGWLQTLIHARVWEMKQGKA